MTADKQLQGKRCVPALELSGAMGARNCLLLGFCAIALRRCGNDGSSTAVHTSRSVSTSSSGYKQTAAPLLQKMWYH